MRVHFVRIPYSKAEDEIRRLKDSGEFLSGFKMKRLSGSILIPVRNSGEYGEFEIKTRKRMSHVGSFERISDFFVIKERDGWEKIRDEIVENQHPRAVFLDRGVEGPLRLRKIERVHGSGEPEGIHRENGLRYMVDLKRAYFSPRLAGLRKLIVDRCASSSKPGLIVDMYAGVGPIIIPLLKRRVRSVGFDMNKEAIDLLSSNLKLNNVNGSITIANSNEIYGCFGSADQVIMNNPSQSIDISKKIIHSFSGDSVIHFLHISENKEPVSFDGLNILEEKKVHGYSPHSTLLYYRLQNLSTSR